jgi:hypothetical protein
MGAASKPAPAIFKNFLLEEFWVMSLYVYPTFYHKEHKGYSQSNSKI